MHKRSSKELKKITQSTSTKSQKNTQIQTLFERVIKLEQSLRNELLITKNDKTPKNKNQNDIIAKTLNKLNTFGKSMTPEIKFKIDDRKYIQTIESPTEQVIVLSHIKVNDRKIQIPEACNYIEIIVNDKSISLTIWAMLLNAVVQNTHNQDPITPMFNSLIELNGYEHGLKIFEVDHDEQTYTSVSFHKDDLINYWSQKLDSTVVSIYVNTVYLDATIQNEIENETEDGYLNVGIILDISDTLARYQLSKYNGDDLEGFIQATIKQLQLTVTTEDEEEVDDVKTNDIEMLNKQITNNEKQIKQLSKEKNTIQKDNAEKDKTIRQLKTQLNNVEQSNTNNANLLKIARNESHQVNALMKKQASEIMELKKKALQINNDSLHQELNNLRTENYDQKIKIEQLKAKTKATPTIELTSSKKRSSYNLTKLNSLSFDI